MWLVNTRVIPSGEILDEASGYLKRRMSIIPLAAAVNGDPSSGKRPLIPWKTFQSRRATQNEIGGWFTGTSHNLGIVTGRISGIVAVDCDDEHAVEWCRRHLADTSMIARTGSGCHLFYTHPGPVIRNGAKLHGLNLDLRADGGYVVAPPSRHHSGKRYEKLGDWSSPPPRFDPSWIVRRNDKPISIAFDDRCNDDQIRIRARKYVERMFSVSGQGGDRNLFRVACVLIQKFGLPFDTALEELRRWNQTNAEPPWNDKRLQYKLNEAMRLK